MPAYAITIGGLRARFAAASGAPPLNDLSARDREELETLLGHVQAFEDLPGRWQAALLAAETGAARSGGCCAS